MKVSIEQLEEILLEGIKKAQDDGMTIICSGWGSKAEKCMCPLTAWETYIADKNSNGSFKETFLDENELMSDFIYGFDKYTVSHPSPLTKLGCKLRERFNPIRIELFMKGMK